MGSLNTFSPGVATTRPGSVKTLVITSLTQCAAVKIMSEATIEPDHTNGEEERAQTQERSTSAKILAVVDEESNLPSDARSLANDYQLPIDDSCVVLAVFHLEQCNKNKRESDARPQRRGQSGTSCCCWAESRPSLKSERLSLKREAPATKSSSNTTTPSLAKLDRPSIARDERRSLAPGMQTLGPRRTEEHPAQPTIARQKLGRQTH
jgi:hypothetical protein